MVLEAREQRGAQREHVGQEQVVERVADPGERQQGGEQRDVVDLRFVLSHLRPGAAVAVHLGEYAGDLVAHVLELLVVLVAPLGRVTEARDDAGQEEVGHGDDHAGDRDGGQHGQFQEPDQSVGRGEMFVEMCGDVRRYGQFQMFDVWWNRVRMKRESKRLVSNVFA